MENGKSSISVEQLDSMAVNVAKSGLFPDINTKEKAFTLMMLCQAEGIHPMQALKKYNIIQGRPAMKADAMLAEFNRLGGKIEWLVYNDKEVKAKFTHSNGSNITIQWTIEMASKIKQSYKVNGVKKEYSLTSKDNWKNYPRQMMKARVISEGLRAIMPEVCMGIYTPEEVQDFSDNDKPKDKPELIEPQAIKENEPKEPETVIDTPKKQPEKQPEKPKETPQSKNTPQTTPQTKLAQINAKFKELKEQLGEDDFRSILKTFRCKTLKDVKTLAKAELIIAEMEATLAGKAVDNA